MKTLSIIIPVYNEEKNISVLVESVLKADSPGLQKEILIVDDGSTDGTPAEIKKLVNLNPNLISIQLPHNQGKGAALKTGFKRATGDILMVQDADMEYNVKDYPSLLKPFLLDNTDVVYGSRNKKRENFHNRYSYFSFYIGGLMLTWFVNILFGLRLTDQPTGYKLFSRKVKNLLLSPTENGFSYEVAMTAVLAQNNAIFIEVPIHYKPRSMKEGKKINALDFIKSVLVAIKYLFIHYGN